MTTHCLACGASCTERDFVLVRDKKRVRIGSAQDAQSGRTARLCRSASCLKSAHSRHLLEQVFHDPSARSLYAELAGILTAPQNAHSGLIGLGIRSGDIQTGFSAVRSTIQNGKAVLIILDDRKSGYTTEKLEQMAASAGIPILRYQGAPAFDRLSGRANCRCAAVINPELAGALQ